jgi:hypothetical protein
VRYPKVYDVGTSDWPGSTRTHAVSVTRWPWGWHWRALCGAKVMRFDRPFRPDGDPAACPDCARYVKGIRATVSSSG